MLTTNIKELWDTIYLRDQILFGSLALKIGFEIQWSCLQIFYAQ